MFEYYYEMLFEKFSDIRVYNIFVFKFENKKYIEFIVKLYKMVLYVIILYFYYFFWYSLILFIVLNFGYISIINSKIML